MPTTTSTLWKASTRVPVSRPTRHVRAFTSTSDRKGRGAAIRAATRSQLTGNPSFRSQAANVTNNKVPNDFGIFPDTIIRPQWNELPNPLRHPLRRLRIEAKCMSQSIRSFLSMFYIYKFAPKKDPLTGKRKTLPLLLRDRFEIARESQKQLYTAVARGQVPVVESLACVGLEKQLKSRIVQRTEKHLKPQEWDIRYRGLTPSPRLWWILQTLTPFRSTKIVSDRVTALPFGNDITMRQVIVRIHSKQRLATEGKLDGAPAKDMTEYLVLNQMRFGDEDKGWRVWGTTQPTTDRQFDEIFESQNSQGSLWDTIKSKMGGGVDTPLS